MARSASIIVLIATQLLCWSGQPLYLCLGGDGSIDVCLGPGHCDCEKSHAECCETRADHLHCGGAILRHREADHHGAIAWVGRASDCDCRHILISQAQAPSISAKSTVMELQDALVPTVTLGGDQIDAVVSLDRMPAWDSTRLLGASSPIALLSTVALRC